MNLSDLTRREQVLVYLRARTGLWVDGTELATESVGGSEGLRRTRELRETEGYNVQTRKHPDPKRDIYQYRIVPGKVPVMDHLPPTPAVPAVENTSPADNRHRAPVDHVRQRELARKTVNTPPPDHSQARMADAVRRREDGTFEYVPPQRPLLDTGPQLTLEAPEQEPEPGAKFTSRPAKIDYGAVAVCPRCKGRTIRGRARRKDPVERPTMETERRRRKGGDGSMPLVDDEGVLLFRDPHSRKARPCERCNGYAIVPNIGPIPFTSPE